MREVCSTSPLSLRVTTQGEIKEGWRTGRAVWEGVGWGRHHAKSF